MAFLAAAAPLLGAIGTVAGAVGTLGTGLYQAQVSRNNKAVAEQNADYAVGAAGVRAQNQGIKNAQKEAGIKTSYAANGIDVNSGSAADVEESQKMVGKLDVESILQQGGLTAWGYKNQAQNFEDQANMDTLGAITGTAATLFEGASKFPAGNGAANSDSWKSARQTVFG